MICALQAFLDFCYLACSDVLDTKSLAAMQDALDRFHKYQEIFRTCSICSSFNLPWQHSLMHFIQMIWAFSAPNGLCSSITESKHIKAVKKPYQWSSFYEALGQMLLINQCVDKLMASWVDFQRCGMLKGTCLSHSLQLVHKLGESQPIIPLLSVWSTITQLVVQLKMLVIMQKMRWRMEMEME